jgi:hypothetical protein
MVAEAHDKDKVLALFFTDLSAAPLSHTGGAGGSAGGSCYSMPDEDPLSPNITSKLLQGGGGEWSSSDITVEGALAAAAEDEAAARVAAEDEAASADLGL